MRIESPCKDCNYRSVGCHSICNDYISYKEKSDNYNKFIRECKAKDNLIKSVSIDSVKRMKKHR